MSEAGQQYGTIVDLGRDGSDPEVLIHGYGRMLLSQLRAKIVRHLEDLAKIARVNNMKGVRYGIVEQLPYFVNAVLDIENQLQDPTIKRKITILKKK